MFLKVLSGYCCNVPLYFLGILGVMKLNDFAWHSPFEELRFIPHVVNKDGGNHDGKCTDTEPRAHVTFGVPLERWLGKQSPEKKSQRRDKGLPKKNGQTR